MRIALTTTAQLVEIFFGEVADEFIKDGDPPIIDITVESLARFYEELFSDPLCYVAGYSRQQIDRAFALMSNVNVPIAVQDAIWSDNLAIETRTRLVGAMFMLYEKLFNSDPLFGAPYMWWDAVITSGPTSHADRMLPSNLAIEQALFETLTQILQLASPHSQRAALHGLNHLGHPETSKAIDSFLHSHPQIEPELRQYAKLASLGVLP